MKKINRRQVGADKEAFVCEWLERHGYKVVQRNFTCRAGEIDIVARNGGYLVFVEVKYRGSDEAGLPEEAVDPRKQRAISRAALFFMTRYGYSVDTPVRFDVAAVYGGDGPSVALYQNAFEYRG